MICAEYFLGRMNGEIDRTKVLRLLLYHDLVEIETGDIPELIPELDHERRCRKREMELQGFNELQRKLPPTLALEYRELFEEFEAGETKEAQFARAIDKLEPMIHQLDHKPDWRRYGYTEEVLLETKGRYMKPFPELHQFYRDLITYLKENDYI
jgi:putative hydrolase of HD superfamily